MSHFNIAIPVGSLSIAFFQLAYNIILYKQIRTILLCFQYIFSICAIKHDFSPSDESKLCKEKYKISQKQRKDNTYFYRYIYIYLTKIGLNFNEYSNENVKIDDGLRGDRCLEGGNKFNRNHHHENVNGQKTIYTNY